LNQVPDKDQRIKAERIAEVVESSEGVVPMKSPTGLKYTAFAGRYRRWKKRCGVTMRQPHKAGDNVFVDLSGKKPFYFDRVSGERIEVELFVATLGVAPDSGSTGKVAVLGAGRRRADAKCAEFEGRGVERGRLGAVRVGGGVLGDRTPSRERTREPVRTCPLGDHVPAPALARRKTSTATSCR